MDFCACREGVGVPWEGDGQGGGRAAFTEHLLHARETLGLDSAPTTPFFSTHFTAKQTEVVASYQELEFMPGSCGITNSSQRGWEGRQKTAIVL